MAPKRCLLLGFGNVGRRCVELMLNGVQPSLTIVGISDSQGGVYNNAGINLRGVLQHKENSKQSVTTFQKENNVATSTSNDLYELCRESDLGLDLVIDVSPVDLKSGGVALPILQDAVQNGINCVLANKAPLVLDYDNLCTTAKANQAKILFSATVCGGLPVINVGTRDLRGCKFQQVSGIFNSTSNYVLSEIENNKTAEQAIKEAQDIGIAEADPSLDIEGYDTANKLVIITNSVMGHSCTLKDVDITGIQNITREMVMAAKEKGEVIRLVATSTVDPNDCTKVAMSVKPMNVPKTSFFGQCGDTSMCVRFETDIFEEIELKTKEKGVYPTSAAVLRDCFDICDS
jgi:homoserine dehydrogenase